MSKRLSKIARDLNIGISTIVDFLSENGYQCEETPNAKISEELVEFINSNIRSYIVESKVGVSAVKSGQYMSSKAEQLPIPLELKIVDAASKNKKLIERIIGFSDFDWHYNVIKCRGVCSQPVDFNLFDDAICAILLKGETSAKTIGTILGFDIETDPAERDLLLSAIQNLKNDKMLDGDESIYWLTDIGREYAKNGVKYSTFERDFELYIDATGDLKGNVKEVFSKLKSEKQVFFQHVNLPQTLDEVKQIAEVQAPEIHFPAKNFILQSYQFIDVEEFKAKVWVILLENFRDNTIRTLVYDEKQDSIINPLSESFDKLEEQKDNLLEKLIRESGENDFSVEITDDQKSESQISIEQDLIKKQDDFDAAVETNDKFKQESIQKEAVEGKRHFNSLEFEVELKRLFDTTSDELWIISPWIKRYATERRIPFFERYLKKGGRVFVAYSQPENGTDIMAEETVLERLYELENKYNSFYILQLPAFHYKRVWLKSNTDESLYYTGSYNVLSFFVKQNSKNYRQEEMTKLDWNAENEKEYQELFIQFGVAYLTNAVKELENHLSKSNNNLGKTKHTRQGKVSLFLDKKIANDVLGALIKKYESLIAQLNPKIPNKDRALSFKTNPNHTMNSPKRGANRLPKKQ